MQCAKPPLSRLCRQLPSMGAFLASPWKEVARSDGVVALLHTRDYRSSYIPPRSAVPTAPLYGSLSCLSLRRGGTQWRSGGYSSTTLRRGNHRLPHATTPQSAVPTAPLYGSLFSLPEEWWQYPKSNLHKINLNLFQKTIDKPKNVCYNELINQ